MCYAFSFTLWSIGYDYDMDERSNGGNDGSQRLRPVLYCVTRWRMPHCTHVGSQYNQRDV